MQIVETINASHREMARFRSNQDAGFRQVAGALRHYISQLEPKHDTDRRCMYFKLLFHLGKELHIGTLSILLYAFALNLPSNCIYLLYKGTQYAHLFYRPIRQESRLRWARRSHSGNRKEIFRTGEDSFRCHSWPGWNRVI